MTAPRRFMWERALLADPEAVGSKLMVLLAVATYGDVDGTSIRPSHQRLAEDCGVSTRTVERSIRWALDAGWLERTHRGHRRGDGTTVTSAYVLTLPQPDTSDGQRDPLNPTRVTDREVSTRHQRRLNPTPVSPQPDTGVDLPNQDQTMTIAARDPLGDAIGRLARLRSFRSTEAARRQLEHEGTLAELEAFHDRWPHAPGHHLVDLLDRGPLYAEYCRGDRQEVPA